MSESSEGQLQNYSVDQAAGAVVLVLGAVASLLLVIWQSRCHCKMNLCYLCQCERKPPPDEGDSDEESIIPKNKKPNDEKEPEAESEPEPEQDQELEYVRGGV